MNVSAFKRYVRRGDSYEVVVQSVVSEGPRNWVRFKRLGQPERKSQWVAKSMFVRRFKEAA